MIEPFYIYDMIDSRIHFLDQMQSSSSITDISDKFEKSNVVASMITGMPVIWSKERKKFYWYPQTDSYLAEMLYFKPTRIKTNFYPFISCVNDSPESLLHVKNMIKTFPDFWRGIGPIFMTQRIKYENYGKYGQNIFKIINIAQKNNLPVHIFYEFNDIETESFDNINLLDKIKEMENDDRDLTIFKLLEKYPRTKFILYFKSFMPINNADSINKLLNTMLSSYPNLTIDLSGKLLENIYLNKQQQIKQVDEEKDIQKIEDAPDVELSRHVKNIFREINSIEDLATVTFGVIDDFLSGEPLKKEEEGEMELSKNIDNGIKLVDNALDNVGDAINNFDFAKAATNFLEPKERDTKAIQKEIAKLGVASMINKYRANMLNEIEQKKYRDDLDLVPKGRIHQDWDLKTPPKPVSQEQIPRGLNDKQRQEIRKRVGNKLVKEIDDKDTGNIESRIKGRSTGAIVPFIAFGDDFRYLEKFENPNIEGFGMFKDLTGIVKDAAEDSVTLPKNPSGKPPPPLTEADLKKNKNILPKVKFSSKSKKLFKDVNNYIDSGELEKDVKDGIKKGANNFFGLDDLGRTIYERPHRGRDGRVYYITNVVTIGEDKYVDVIDIVTRKRRRYFKDLGELFPDLETPGFDLDDLKDDSLKNIYQDNLNENELRDRENKNKNLFGDELKKDKIDYTKNQLSQLFNFKNTDKDVNELLNKNKYQIGKFERIRKDWLKLIETYPEQFIVGTGIVSNFDNYTQKIVICNKLLGDLTPSTAVKVSKINFIKLVS